MITWKDEVQKAMIKRISKAESHEEFMKDLFNDLADHFQVARLPEPANEEDSSVDY
jgi:hypothetical protein